MAKISERQRKIIEYTFVFEEAKKVVEEVSEDNYLDHPEFDCIDAFLGTIRWQPDSLGKRLTKLYFEISEGYRQGNGSPDFSRTSILMLFELIEKQVPGDFDLASKRKKKQKEAPTT